MHAFVKLFFIVNFIHKIYSFCPVHLTISSNSVKLRDATLIVNWDPKCDELPSRIRIYSENPYLTKTPALNEIDPKNIKSGQIDTKIRLENLVLPTLWNVQSNEGKSQESGFDRNDETCANYYALSFNKTNQVTNFNCLKINPQWMTNNKDIWTFPLKELLIPGSKCSGCYSTERNSKRKNLKDESFHQNMDIWYQLIFGVRYLDFSVGYFRSFHKSLDIRTRFWIFNDEHEISPLFLVLEDVLRFAELSREILILDFRNFTYGFHKSSGAHEILKKLLHNMFGHVAMVNNGRSDVKSYDFTILQMKKASKNVLILYNYEDLSTNTEQNQTILWPVWNRIEIQTNENVAKVMSTELSTKYRTDNNDGWVLTANYTKGNADMINSYILSTMNGPWSSKMNVISLDYVFSTNLIDISLSVNHHKALAQQNFIIIDL